MVGKFVIFKDKEFKVIDPIFQPFKRITSFHFHYKEYTLQLLNILKQANIVEVEQMYFSSITQNEFEEIIDPNNFNYKIQKLWYWINDLSLFNGFILNSLSIINPADLILRGLDFIKDEIKILSQLPEINTVYFNWDSSSYFSMKFLNTPIIFKDKNEPVKFNWRDVEILCNDKIKIDDILFLGRNKICIRNIRGMKFSQYKKESLLNIFDSEVLNFK